MKAIRYSAKTYFFKFFVLLGVFVTLNFPAHAKKRIKSLKHQKINSLEIIYDSGSLKRPGDNLSFGVAIHLSNNQVINTQGYLNGSVRWNNFNIELLGAKSFRDKISIPGNTDLVAPNFIVIVVRSKNHDNIVARKRIELNYLTGIEVFPVEQSYKSPGHKIYTGIVKTYDNGQKRVVADARSLREELKNYESICDGGNFYSGKFFIEKDIFRINNHHVGFWLLHKKNNNLIAHYETTLDYIDNFNYYESGLSGSDGNDGTNGTTGSDGDDGKDGDNGDDGSDGKDAADLEVFAEAYFDTILQTDLVKVLVHNLYNEKTKYYLINPNGGSLKVYSSGGDGGNGGNGGDGGDGGDGGQGGAGKRTEKTITKTVTGIDGKTKEEKETIVEVEKGSDGGDGGKGGNGGDGGDGGNICLLLKFI